MAIRVLVVAMALLVLCGESAWARTSRDWTQFTGRATSRQGGGSAQQSRMQAMQQQMRLRMGQMQATAKARAQAARHHQQWRMDGLKRAQQIREARAADAAKADHKTTSSASALATSSNSGTNSSSTAADIKVAHVDAANPKSGSGSSGKKP